MSKSLPNFTEYIDLINQGTQQANQLTQFLNDLTLEMAAVYSFFFLPFFLLAWLGILRLFEYEKKTRQIIVPILVLSYFGCIGFLKFEGEKQAVVSDIENQVAYYMAYNCVQQMPIGELCAHTPLKNEDVEILAEARTKTFSIIQGALHIKDSKIVSVIKKRLKDLGEVIIANSSQEQHLRVDSLIQVANEVQFGELSNETLEQVARENPDKITYKESVEGDYLIVEP